MAIALDTSATIFAGTTGASTSVSAAYTVSGSNPLLHVGVVVTNSTADWVTGVTYNGVAASRVAKSKTTYLYTQSNPSTGSHTLAVTFNSPFLIIGVASASYSGASTFTGASLDNSTTQVNTGTANQTVTLTTVADNCWTVILGASVFSTVLQASSGVTSRQVINNVGSGSFSIVLGDSAGPIHPAGAYSMSLNSTGADTIESIMASFSPTGGGGATVAHQSVFTSMGIGG